MAKKGKAKVSERVISYYRGPICKPTRVATQDDMDIIKGALKECRANQNCQYQTTLNGKQSQIKVIFGLSSCLRHLKRRQTKALIYDNTASPHLSKFLNNFAQRLEIPIIEASGLINFAPKLKLKTALTISLISAEHDDGLVPIKSREFDKFCGLFEAQSKPNKFRAGLVEKVKSRAR